MSQEQLFTYEVRDGVGLLTLNRPQKFNALSKAMIAALNAQFDKIAGDSAVRVVVLAAHGKAFCAGHDLTEMLDDLSYDAMHELFGNCSVMMQKIQSLPQPVIASIDGIATAAGCQLAAACDLAIASDVSRFATSGINVGLFCATPMVAITRVMPKKAAFEMLTTGDFIPADKAAQLGLINRAVPQAELEATVMEMAQKIANKSPRSVAMGKQAFYQQLSLPLPEAYSLATDTIVRNALLDDTQAGIAAFARKEPPPQWKDRDEAAE